MSELSTTSPSPSPHVPVPPPPAAGHPTSGSQLVAPPAGAFGPPRSRFEFDGGAGSYLLVGIGAFLLTLVTFGLATPWAVCMTYRWRTEHTLIDGRRLRFTGTGMGLFGHWVKWWLLILVTFGVYGLWVYPRLVRWMTEKQDL